MAVVSGDLSTETGGLGAVGVSRVLQGAGDLDDSQLGRLVTAAAQQEEAAAVVCAQDHLGKAVAGRVAVRLGRRTRCRGYGRSRRRQLHPQCFQRKSHRSNQRQHGQVGGHHDPERHRHASPCRGHSLHCEAFNADLGERKVTILEAAAPSSGGRAPLPEAELVVSAGRRNEGPRELGL